MSTPLLVSPSTTIALFRRLLATIPATSGRTPYRTGDEFGILAITANRDKSLVLCPPSLHPFQTLGCTRLTPYPLDKSRGKKLA